MNMKNYETNNMTSESQWIGELLSLSISIRFTKWKYEFGHYNLQVQLTCQNIIKNIYNESISFSADYVDFRPGEIFLKYQANQTLYIIY